MADYAPTAADAGVEDNATVGEGTAAEAIDQLVPVYRKTADKKIAIGDANGTAEEADIIGITITKAAADQKVLFVQDGDINLGAVLTDKIPVILSATKGKMAPHTDLASGMHPVILGIPKSTSILAVKILKDTSGTVA